MPPILKNSFEKMIISISDYYIASMKKGVGFLLTYLVESVQYLNFKFDILTIKNKS